MPLTLSPVTLSDADALIRTIDHPACTNDPLRKIMFPTTSSSSSSLSDTSSSDTEDQIKWHIANLKSTIAADTHVLLKVTDGPGGPPLGFAGWILHHPSPVPSTESAPSAPLASSAPLAPSAHSAPSAPATAPATAPADSNAPSATKAIKIESREPRSLDIKAWIAVSMEFRRERDKLLHNRTNVWRLTTLATSPPNQRQGIASLLLSHGCAHADRHGYDSFVNASPPAVRLYERFGYEKVGEVVTGEGVFTFMFRRFRKGTAGAE